MDIREKREREKLLGMVKLDGNQQMVVTHLTIRQSIFFLVLKLTLIEILAAICLIFFLTNIFSNPLVTTYNLDGFLIPAFIIVVFIKSGFTFFTIIQWLEEYYEITPNWVKHKNGFLFKSEEKYRLDHIGSIDLEQGILGRIFNYGTIRLYDWALDRNFYLYLIHNPLKYHKIMETMLPESDTEKKVFRQKVVEMEE